MFSTAIRSTAMRTATVLGVLATAAAGTVATSPASAAPTGNNGLVFSTATASAAAAQAAPGRSTADAVQRYWTPTRMKAAITADTLVSAKARPTKAQADQLAKPNGPAVKIAGAAPTVKTKAKAVNPNRAPKAASGRQALATGNGSNWWGSFWSPPATTTGKVFFTAPNGLGYVCSGSSVNSEARNTVFTAGHCVSDGAGRFHTNWVFVPDYSYGYAPFGSWSAKALGTTSQWFYNSDFRYDIGAAVLNRNSSGQNLINITGGQGIAWNQARGQYIYAFGYPQAAPFDGGQLKYCDGYTFNDGWSGGANLGLYCNFTGGSSGGPWLGWFNGTWGYVNGVNSYKYGSLPAYIFSPYFGSAAGSLYNAVRYYY